MDARYNHENPQEACRIAELIYAKINEKSPIMKLIFI